MAARRSPPPVTSGEGRGPGRWRVGRPGCVVAATAAFITVAVLSGACGGSAGDDPAAPVAGPDASGTAGDLDVDVGRESGAGTEADAAGVVLLRFDGSEARLADYRGRPLVVNFFASWCAPCIKEMPEFERVHQELGDAVTFLGVNVRDRAEAGRRLAQQTGVSFELLRDPRGELLAAVGGQAMPTTAFVTADGRLVRVENRIYQADTLRAAIVEVLQAAADGATAPRDPPATRR